MGNAAKFYIYNVIAAGGCLLAVALANWSSPDRLLWAIYLLLAVLASAVKLKLPSMDGTYSLSFLFLLYGIAHFSLAETLLAGCAGAVAQSLFNAKRNPSLIQVLFNAANVTVSVGACFLIARVWLASGMVQYRPATMAVVACAYFIVNTVLVSGVLSLLQNKPLGEVCSRWYVWSFPYYLVGVALVGLFPSPGRSTPGEAWLILLPLIYLVHFFLGLVEWHASSPATGNQPDAVLPRAARVYIAGVVTAGLIPLVVVALDWQSQNLARFISYLALATPASTLKIPLPHTRGTLTPAFVLLLAASGHRAVELAGNRGPGRSDRRGAGTVAVGTALHASPGAIQSGQPVVERHRSPYFVPRRVGSLAGPFRGGHAGGLRAGPVRFEYSYGGHRSGTGQPETAEQCLATLLLLVAPLLPGGCRRGRYHGGHQPHRGLAPLVVGSADHGAGVCFLSRTATASCRTEPGGNGIIYASKTNFSLPPRQDFSRRVVQVDW